MLTSEQKILCVITHLGVCVGIPIVAPLIVLLVSTDPFVKQQAKEALGFHIFLAIVAAIATILIIGIIFLPLIWLISVIFGIIALVKVLDGNDYSYPVTGSFVRKNF